MRNFFKISLVAGITAMLFTACLKDTPTTDYSDTSIKPIVLIPNGNFPSTQEAAIVTFEVSTTPEEVKLYARVSWSKPLGKAIDVTFVKKPSLITEFNTKFGTSYAEMNADAYSIPTYKVTIAADQNEAYIPVKIFTDKVSLTQANMLAFSISDASGETISSNFQNIVLPIGVKNKYDGVYALRSKSVGWGAYGIADGATFSYPAPGIGLVTAGASSVSTIAYNFGWNLLYAFTASGSSTGFGATTPRFIFDGANNLTSVVNTTPDDGRGRVLLLNPAVTDSRFDPATKKIYAAFIMKQNGRPDQFRYDTLTRTGAR
ncbi:MAG: DUF1735 domain-containing protein [Chitinophagaceae bacterium]